MRPAAVVVLAAGVALAGGCTAPAKDSSAPAGDSAAGAASPSTPGLRAAHDAWVRLEGADDPYHDPARDDLECSPVGWEPEDAGFFEIESDLCSLATWEQPLLGEVKAGETLTFVFWHLDLWADPPTLASVELSIDGVPFWRYEVQVPSAEYVEQVAVPAPADAAAGAPVRLHLDNHGVNSWRVGELSLE